MKRSSLAALATAATLAVTSLGVSQPAAAQAASTKTGIVKVTDQPAHTFTAAEKQALKDRSAKRPVNATTTLTVSPQSIEVKPTGPGPAPATAIVEPYGSTADSWTPLVAETLENRVETCLATQPAGTWWNGFVLNHLAGCATALTNAVVWDINGNVIAQAPFTTTTLYVAMKPGDPSRTWRAYSYVTVGEATGDYQAVIDQVNNGPIRLRLPCAPSTGATECVSSGDTTMSVNQWRANNGSGPVEFTMVAKDGDGWAGTSDAGIARYTTGWFMEWVGGTTVETPGVQVRCDYQPGFVPRTGCVFPAGRHHMERNALDDTSIWEAARHIYDALYYPNSTDPLSNKVAIPKFIPGLESSGVPLTRLWEASGRTNKANHDKARRTCISVLGQKEYDRLVALGDQCDEFPWASTHQGTTSGGDFSVRMIPASQNRISGDTYLNHWYSAWRMLDGDAFFVDVPTTLPVP